MLVNNKTGQDKSWLRWGGCSCHNSKAARRRAKHKIKQREKRAWLREL